MIDFFERLFGPYPFDAYGAVHGDDPDLYYALETQAMSTFQQDYVDEADGGPRARPSMVRRRGDRRAMARPVAGRGLRHLFRVALGSIAATGPGLEAAFADLYAYVVGERGRPGGCQPARRTCSPTIPTTAARSTLHALRLDVGDRDFFRILRSYYRTYRNGNATSADFIDVAARQSDRGGVRRLLHAWLYDQAVPPMPGAAAQARQAGAATPPSLGVGVRRH